MIETNKILTLATLFLLTISLAGAQSNEKDYSRRDFRYVPNEAFGFGEILEYEVGYKFIVAGKGGFRIMPDPVYRHGRPCYDIRFRVQSLESLSKLYRVDDRYQTLMDVAGLFPWEFEQHVREGNYRRDFQAKFDQVENIAIAGKVGKEKETYDVPKYVHDIVSAFYHVRAIDLSDKKKGEVFELKQFFDDTTYTLGVKILGRQEIKVKAGKFKCLVIEPLVVEGGLFESEGQILIWLTDDERKIPVKVATKILIGYVGAELVHYEGVRGSIDAKLE